MLHEFIDAVVVHDTLIQGTTTLPQVREWGGEGGQRTLLDEVPVLGPQALTEVVP